VELVVRNDDLVIGAERGCNRPDSDADGREQRDLLRRRPEHRRDLAATQVAGRLPIHLIISRPGPPVLERPPQCVDRRLRRQAVCRRVDIRAPAAMKQPEHLVAPGRKPLSGADLQTPILRRDRRLKEPDRPSRRDTLLLGMVKWTIAVPGGILSLGAGD
jgi:hypothetical protein